jgi:CDGSH iron-sulfur domain-containing protein 3
MEKPVIAQKGPYVLNNEVKTFFWCACGKSSNQPYCDGSHKGSFFLPVKMEILKEGKNAWCGCKHTSNPPFCDGTHAKL